ncbi:hypothetical protein BVG19_g3307 [[Candida] boidinii]|nr:hypothetical protein BVG19_g3307 [[Candida] boidinii]OWB52152.1 hypothetical protein B5S27_g3724 [[Candida] boidinii]
MIPVSKSGSSSSSFYLDQIQDSDIEFEKKLLKDPYDLKTWLAYIDHKQNETAGNLTEIALKQGTFSVLRRATNSLYGSYKLWNLYLTYRLQLIDEKIERTNQNSNSISNSISNTNSNDIISVNFDLINDTVQEFNRAELTMNKYPKFWELFLNFIVKYKGIIKIEFILEKFDTCFQRLTILQHEIIWPIYLLFADQIEGEIAFEIWFRFFEFKSNVYKYIVINKKEMSIEKNNENETPEETSEETIIVDNDFDLILDKLTQYISNSNELKKLTKIFDKILNNNEILLKFSKSEVSIYINFLEILINFNPKMIINEIQFDKFINYYIDQIILKFPDQFGKFIVKLSNYYIKRKNLLKIRPIFENGLNNCRTIKDFTLIFDSYLEFEDLWINKLSDYISFIENEDVGNDKESFKDKDWLKIFRKFNNNEINEIFEFSIERFENLMKRRELLINDVLLRQNKNKVETWLNRIKLFDINTQYKEILKTFSDALITIDINRIESEKNLVKLWIEYANIYNHFKNYENVRKIYKLAIKVPFKDPENLIDIILNWYEFELSINEFDNCLKIFEDLLVHNNNLSNNKFKISEINYKDENISSQIRIIKSLRLWNSYLDFIESGGEIGKVCEIYDKILELKIATPLTIINYCDFLENNKYFNKMFKIYEKSVHIFSFPVVFEIWNIYLIKVIKYYKTLNLNIELVRDLFEQCLDKCPKELIKPIYLLYSDFEFANGSKSISVKILKDSINIIKFKNSEEKLEIYKIIIVKLTKFEKREKIREIYQDAIEDLPVSTNGFIDDIVLSFINLEISLNQIERARSIFKYACEIITIEFKNDIKNQNKIGRIWDEFKEFELKHGNVSNYRDMLRFKRNIEEKSGRSNSAVIKENDKFIQTQSNNDNSKIKIANGSGIDFVASSSGPKIGTISSESATGANNNAESGIETVKIKNEDAIDIDIDIDDLSD